jgi:predicted nucleic acid-binding protein
MPDALIVNASPLIFLGNAGRIDLLRAVGAARVLVTDAVFNEVTLGGHADRASSALVKASWIERAGAPEIPPTIVEWDLGAGESSVVAAALTHPGASVVIDDLSGRKCALAMGVKVMGTLGLVIAAHRRGVVEDPRQVLLELRASGMWLSDAVISRALAIAGVKT